MCCYIYASDVQFYMNKPCISCTWTYIYT